MTPIRVGIIGLSSKTGDQNQGSGWAASAHLPYLLASPHYTITALCNSTISAAQTAIQLHSLPATTKAYGSAADLASDPDVDLVVCSVRVDLHYQLILPAVQAGKSVFVEWPLGSNLPQAEELLAAARASGSKTIVGLQGRVSPFTLKVKALVEQKVIGELLSSEFSLALGMDGDAEPAGVDYLVKKEVGGNLHSIMFGHPATCVLFALGGDVRDMSAVLATRWAKSRLFHPDGTFKEWVTRETPDHVMLQGTMKGSGAPVSIYVRSGKAFADEPKLKWRVLGTKGELRITSSATLGVALGKEKIEFFDHEKGSVEVLDAQYMDAVKDLTPLAKNIGGLYELFATGKTPADGLVDFEQAVQMHKIIDGMEKSWEEKRFVKLSD